MKNRKRASDVGTSQDSNKNTLYSITALMAVATVISGWHIVDVWSGIVCLICFMATLALYEEAIR